MFVTLFSLYVRHKCFTRTPRMIRCVGDGGRNGPARAAWKRRHFAGATAKAYGEQGRAWRCAKWVGGAAPRDGSAPRAHIARALRSAWRLSAKRARRAPQTEGISPREFWTPRTLSLSRLSLLRDGHQQRYAFCHLAEGGRWHRGDRARSGIASVKMFARTSTVHSRLPHTARDRMHLKTASRRRWAFNGILPWNISRINNLENNRCE